MMTEEEAKAKWCPFARLVLTSEGFPSGNRFQENSFVGETRCIGSACMAWRKYTAVVQPMGTPKADYGYCGLAGRPA